MDLNTLCLESVGRHLKALGIECGEPDSHRLESPGLAMVFLAEDAGGNEGASMGCSVAVTIEARALGEDSPGVRVLALGLGATLKEAATDAGHQWSTGVAPVIASHILDRDIEHVQKARMVVEDEETGETYKWTAHLGPVLGRVFGPPGSSGDLGDTDPVSAYRPVFEAVHPHACHASLMWIESFAAKYPDGKVDATCRMNNNDWEQGRNALLAWAASWPNTRGCLVSKRQFILMRPTATEDLPAELNAKLNQAVTNRNRPWWQKLAGSGKSRE